MQYRAILIFGAPGSGKGTQGKILGQIPGYYHCSCGEVFRGLDLTSDIGKVFLTYSGRGQLVPDEFTVKLWANAIQGAVYSKRFNPEHDLLVLDGIPRNIDQAQMMLGKIKVEKLFHLICSDGSLILERLKKRALRENRLDDANEETIYKRLEVYEKESSAILNYYSKYKIINIDATRTPIYVHGTILKELYEFHSEYYAASSLVSQPLTESLFV